MDVATIEQIIASLSSAHPLRDEKKSEYKKTFEINFAKLNGIKEDKAKKLLCGDTDFYKFKYNQGVAELMLYFLLTNANICFEIEKKVNPLNNKDVDVSAVYEGITYNIEVKSPEYENNQDNMLIGGFANRFGEKEVNQRIMDDIATQLHDAASQCGIKGVKQAKVTDDKVKECLLSAQEKFSIPTDKNCNILLIITTTSEMINYWNYIINNNSGFFNPYSDVSLFNYMGKCLSKADYNKVNAIILSNAITLNEKYDSTSWDMAQAINIVLMNPSCECTSIYGLQVLSDFFPHQTCEFAKGLFEFKRNHPEIPEECFPREFVAKHGYSLKPGDRRSQE